MKEIKKIDMHAHAVQNPDIIPGFFRTGDKAMSKEDLLGTYDRLNIQQGVLLPIVDMVGQAFLYSNEGSKILADTSEGRLMWFCNVSPHAMDNKETSDLSYIINYYKSLGAKGVGEVTSQLYVDDPKMDNLFYHCAQNDMPVTIHVHHEFGGNYGVVDDLGLPRIEKMLKKHKNLKLIGHATCFWTEISGAITEKTRYAYPSGKVTEGTIARLLREYDNLYCDISAGSGANAMMRDREYTARFMEEFSDRILYGTDACNNKSTFSYELDEYLDAMVSDGYLSVKNYTKIVRDNAAKLLGINV